MLLQLFPQSIEITPPTVTSGGHTIGASPLTYRDALLVNVEAPAVVAPAVEAPAVVAPAVEAPVVVAPVVVAPAVEAPDVLDNALDVLHNALVDGADNAWENFRNVVNIEDNARAEEISLFQIATVVVDAFERGVDGRTQAHVDEALADAHRARTVANAAQDDSYYAHMDAEHVQAIADRIRMRGGVADPRPADEIRDDATNAANAVGNARVIADNAYAVVRNVEIGVFDAVMRLEEALDLPPIDNNVYDAVNNAQEVVDRLQAVLEDAQDVYELAYTVLAAAIGVSEEAAYLAGVY